MSNVEYDIHIYIYKYIRRRKLLDDVKDRRGYSHLKEEAMWRNRFGGGFGPVVRQNVERMNIYMYMCVCVCVCKHVHTYTIYNKSYICIRLSG